MKVLPFVLLAITSLGVSAIPLDSDPEATEIFMKVGPIQHDPTRMMIQHAPEFTVGTTLNRPKPNPLLKRDVGLTKRAHGGCLYNDLSSKQKKEAYHHDYRVLINKNARSATAVWIEPGKQVELHTDQRRYKIVVKNEGTCTKGRSCCRAAQVWKTTIAFAAEETLIDCPGIDNLSGWGYVGQRGGVIIYIIEPMDLAPPPYSPRCDPSGP